MTLTEFLLARIAEDEDEASLFPIGPVDDNATALVNMFAARVIAECEAKRRIVEEGCATVKDFDDPVAQWLRDSVLRALSLPYADHPDYREEWKP